MTFIDYLRKLLYDIIREKETVISNVQYSIKKSSYFYICKKYDNDKTYHIYFLGGYIERYESEVICMQVIVISVLSIIIYS